MAFGAFANQRVTFKLNDLEGQNGITGVYPRVPEDTSGNPSANLTTLATTLKTITLARFAAMTVTAETDNGSAVAAANGPYQNIEDKAFFEFKSVKGDVTVIEVPSPVDTVFKTANREEIDDSNADVIAFITAVLAYAAEKGGQQLAAYLRGYRSRKKHRS